MAGKSYKYVVVESTVADAISTFYSEIEELGQESREVVENASENLAQTGRIQTFGDTADALENISEADAPEFTGGEADPSALKINVSVAQPKSKRQAASRAVRCENACGYGRSGIDALRAWCDEQDEKTDSTEDEKDFVQEVRDYADEVEGHIDEAEGVEFPGMYG